MKFSGRASFIVLLLMLSVAVPTIFGFIDVSGAPSRGAEEDIWIDMTVEFDGVMKYLLDIDVNIYRMTIDNITHGSEDLRILFNSDPNGTEEMIGEEVKGRMEDLTSNSFTGDEHEMVRRELVLSTMDENLTGSDPIRYVVEIMSSIDLGRYLDQELLDRLEPGRENPFIIGMLMSGFEFSRTATLRADPGQRVTYDFPSSWDPFGDDEILVLLRENGVDPVDGSYVKELDSGEGEFVDHFTFSLRTDPRSRFAEEVISGSIDLDWYQLDRLDIGGIVDLGPLESGRSTALEELPPSMSTPEALPPGFIRFAHGEGILTNEDITDIEEQISQEMEDSMANKFDGSDMDISAGMTFDPYSAPVNGMGLWSLISDNTPNPVSIQTVEPLELDILDDYDLDDVVGLLNGGLRIRRDLDQITDDRLSVNITLPNDLVFSGETPLSVDAGRSKYVYSGGYKLVGSAIAPEYVDEKVDLDAVIDLSQVNSHYISDMEIEVAMDATISVHRMEFDPNDFDVNTDLDYELDYLSSDLIRILDRMEMVNRSEIENKVREEVMDLIVDLLDEEGREIVVQLDEDTMAFDEDLVQVDDLEPIHIVVKASGTTKPLVETGESSGSMERGNRFLPPHLNPLIPVKSIFKTIDISDTRDWNSNLKVIFPSGFGVKAWLGEGSNDKVSPLDVITENGYPTLIITPEDGEGNHITLELTVGPYFAYNNVTACFFSATGVVLLVALLIVIFIIRGLARRRKEKKGEREEGQEEEDGEDAGADEKDTEKEAGGDGNEETLSW